MVFQPNPSRFFSAFTVFVGGKITGANVGLP